MRRALSLVVFLPFLSVARADEKPYEPRPKGTVTYTKHIAPIVNARCAACHRPGEVAPFSLLQYEDVRKRAKLISKMTERRIMPPWKPDDPAGTFRGEHRLTAEQIGMIGQWTKEGTIEGDAKDLPPPPKFAVGWQLGEPDMIVTMPKEYTLAAESRDVYRNFVIPFEVPAGKYIKAVEFRPGNRRIVHHAGFAIDAAHKFRDRDGKDGAPGFTQVGIPGQLFPGNLAFWVPGIEPRPLPDGTGVTWPKGADLVLQLHLHPSGKPETERSTIGFYFTSETPRRPLQFIAMSTNKIDIPPGEKAYRTRQTRTIDNDIELLGLFPHMHVIGKETTVTAVLPGGESKRLLHIPDWDFNWQNYYEYVKPLNLPRGTQIVLECVHDNSAENPANPNSPPKRIVFGEQTTNEMAAVFINAMPKPGTALAKAGKNVGPGDDTDLKQKVAAAMRLYDKDGDGKLSRDEIKLIPAAQGLDIDAVIRRFDRDGDGKLDAAELLEALRALRGS
jgi:hypothetical protein